MSADSIEAEPPILLPVNKSLSGATKPSFLQKLKVKQSPPISFETQAQRHNKHKRSNSLGEIVSRILPSHREERGHTLRRQYDKNSSQDPVELVFGVSDLRLDEVWSDGSRTGLEPSLGSRFVECRTSHNQRLSNNSQNGGGSDHGSVSKIRPGGGDSASQRVTHGRSYAASWGQKLGLRKDSDDRAGLHDQPTEDQGSKTHLLNGEINSPKDSKTQKIFQDKKAQREQRRSLRESGDFLGVQGANPRTGLWDVSSGTSSSEPSQMSEETKKRLDEETKNIEEQKRRYEEAKAKHETELTRVHDMQEEKKREKEKRKKLELKMKQRRRGKWKLSEEGWHSLAEPELSPIIQSVAGSPGKEIAPGDRLFPMPTAEDPTPYVNPNNIAPRDYFGHRLVSSPLAKERLSAQSGSPYFFRRGTSIPRKAVGSPSRQKQEEHTNEWIQGQSIGSPSRRKLVESTNTIVHTASEADSVPVEHPTKAASGSVVDEVRSRKHALCNDERLQGSSQHKSGFKNNISIAQNSRPLDKTFVSTSPSQNFGYFLDKTLDRWVEDLLGKQAIATSSRSASTNQAVNLRQPDHNHEATSPGKCYYSPKEFPPVTLRNPFLARIPLNSRPIASTIWASPTFLSGPRRPTPRITTIPTTIITGPAQLLPLPVQSNDQNKIRGRRPSLQRGTIRIPLRTTSLPKDKQPDSQSKEFQVNPADIVISSEHHLASTKQWTAELCHTTSPGGEKVAVRSTPISISMFHPARETVSPAARVAFLTPLQNLKRRAAMKIEEAHSRGSSLTPLELRRPVREVGNINPKSRVAEGGPGGIEDLFKPEGGDYDAYRHMINEINTNPVRREAWEDSLMIWHPSPTEENRNPSRASISLGSCSISPPRSALALSPGKLTSDQEHGIERGGSGPSSSAIGGLLRNYQNHPRTQQPEAATKVGGKQLVNTKKGASTHERECPKSAAPARWPSMRDISKTGLQVIHSAWDFVEPAFNSNSDLRKRWDAGCHTVPDMVLFVAAGAFTITIFLTLVWVLGIIATGLQIGKGFWKIFRILIGL